MVLGSAFDILSSCWPPRTSFVNYPLGHQAGKKFNPSDQLRLVKAALEGFETFRKPGQVNVLDCNWGDTVDTCATVGGKEVVLLRDTATRYQCQEDLDAAVALHGAEEAGGIVSDAAVRQRKVLGY
eukprot:gnl/TRDRNA2_/TRDRNA2_157449_c0_seq1.p1 gnl/TRDRNA2_/TRDRNA2_157449_c0~~gnl/TRDRNA2_/TRDRNA2_157449_c0_seq1.p1  ORF type:complete len:126 (+),score=23.90 gnl/TRDRNA2_/TRDRNA2_157449_c0_seq1:357-734(+)